MLGGSIAAVKKKVLPITRCLPMTSTNNQQEPNFIYFFRPNGFHIGQTLLLKMLPLKYLKFKTIECRTKCIKIHYDGTNSYAFRQSFVAYHHVDKSLCIVM